MITLRRDRDTVAGGRFSVLSDTRVRLGGVRDDDTARRVNPVQAARITVGLAVSGYKSTAAIAGGGHAPSTLANHDDCGSYFDLK
jgi:hypothetical protein